MISLFKKQKELTVKIERVIPQIRQEEDRIRKQGQWSPEKEKPLIDTICLQNGIYRMREHVRKIKNGVL